MGARVDRKEGRIVATGYADIRDYIMEKIDSGEWAVGTMIPTEMQLCEQFDVSRPTVRAALMKLVKEGHLKRVKGKGTFVTVPKILDQSTVFIESFFWEMREQGLEITTEVMEFRRIPVTEHWQKLLESDDTMMIKLSRLRYVKDSFGQGPIVLTTSYFSGDKEFLLEHDFEHKSMSSVLKENGFRKEYVEKEFTSVILSPRECRFLGMKEGTPGMRVDSVVRDADGDVVEVSESLYPTSRNKFILKLHL